VTWLLAAALAAPSHVRAVAEQPGSLRELDRPRPARAWWDGGPALVEVDLGRGWASLGEQDSGVRIGPLEAGARVRVTQDGVGEEVQVQLGLDPSGLARLAAPGALPGLEVADIAATDEGAWAALLDGGLVRLDKNSLVVESIGVAEGLPSNQVNAVRADEAGAWVGTGLGLVRLVEGGVTGVWDELLPDPWVQALAVEGESLWVGTFKGLARLRAETVEQVLGPLSVFSLEPGPDERLWAGYEGLQGLPDGEPIEGVDAELNVWDLDTFGRRVYLATDSEGVMLLREGVLQHYWTGSASAYALARYGPALYVAADAAGLVQLSDQPSAPATRSWGQADGLPSDVVYEVEGGPRGKLWVGTDRGLALMWPAQDVVVPWPVSPLAAGRPVYAVLDLGKAVLVGTDEGVAAIGPVPRGAGDLLAVPGPVIGLFQDGRVTWAVTETDAWRLERGHLERFPLPVTALSAALGGGSLWVGSEQGLHRMDAGLGRFVPGPAVGTVRLLEGDGALVWAVAGGRVLAIDGAGGQRDFLRVRLPTAIAPSPQGLWVGTERGPQLLDPYSGEVRDIEGLDQRVEGLAVDPQGRALAWLDSGDLVWLSSGLPVVGGPPAWSVGEAWELEIDASGRIWMFGSRGAALLPAQ
jgi:hypothetical protein